MNESESSEDGAFVARSMRNIAETRLRTEVSTELRFMIDSVVQIIDSEILEKTRLAQEERLKSFQEISECDCLMMGKYLHYSDCDNYEANTSAPPTAAPG